MRTIKFRGWHTKAKKMFSAEEMVADQLTLLPTGQFINVHSTATNLSEIYPTEKFIPLQFTGLTDKSGKEIFDGDILKSAYNGNHAVVWTAGSAHWGIDHKNDCCRPWKGPLSGHAHMEVVIGNVYENPELLDKETA